MAFNVVSVNDKKSLLQGIGCSPNQIAYYENETYPVPQVVTAPQTLKATVVPKPAMPSRIGKKRVDGLL